MRQTQALSPPAGLVAPSTDAGSLAIDGAAWTVGPSTFRTLSFKCAPRLIWQCSAQWSDGRSARHAEASRQRRGERSRERYRRSAAKAVAARRTTETTIPVH